MKKYLVSLLCVAVWLLGHCMLLSTKAVEAKPLPKRVLVLPFQAVSGPELPNAARAIPEQIITALKGQALETIPLNQASSLLKESGSNTIDLAKARAVGERSGADLVIYGSFNQLGDGFTLETRLVPVQGGSAVPVGFEKNSLLALQECTTNIASKAGQILGGSTATPQTPGPVKVQDFVPMGKMNPALGGITDIQIRGMQVMDPDTVLMRLTIRKGDTPDANAINEEVKRVWEMGYFSDVQASMEGRVLVFTVVEKPRIDKIRVEGSDALDEDDVLGAMGTQTGTVLNESMIADDLQKITELYHKEGYYLAKVDYKLEKRPGHHGAVLVLKVTEGHKLYIKEVNVDGLKDISRGDLDKYMALQPRGLFSFLTGSGVLKDEYLERDTNAIAAYGLNEGYIDIQVSAPEVKYKDDGIYVNFTVDEGPRYTVRSVSFSGDVIDSEDEMKKIIEMDTIADKKDHFRVSVMQEDSKKLTEYYTNFGYAFAEIDTRVNKADDGSTQVDVEYFITKKQRVFIRRLTVDGNVKTRDNVILREMRLGDGDMYDGSKLRRSTERLNRLRYFSSVETELVPTGNEDEVDLKVKVKESNTGALMGGIGYSTYYDVGVTASIMERNLFGRGYWLQLQGFFSWRMTSGVLSFTNPRLYDTDLSVGNDLYYTRQYWDNFSKETIGDTIRVAYPIGEYTTVGAAYRLERYYLSDVYRNASPYIRKYKGTNWTSAVSARITRDTTDSRERPTKGTITRLWTEYGGNILGGSDNFYKIVGDWQGFASINPQHTFHVRARLGAVFENSQEDVPVFERFWVGGMDTIRGYSYSDLSPRDYKYNGDQIGGDRMGVLNVEYIWTFQKELGLALVPFFDAGFNIDNKTMGKDLDKYMAASAGLEVRWRSPMGDLRIAYGIPLVQDYDGERESGRLEFSMGQFF
ncbi:MAG: outer membrane protein assembly factor BamA [Desulfovibrionaceae bacterium]|nr:outer membrane protein assembly factor BamA [Desulfovibrionaceae bacterium]